MALHERAWAGLSIMVYGNTPLAPMKLEQAIAAATPNNEVKIDSFENYGDAFDYCKDKRNIGFIFLFENCGQLPAHDVFAQLAKPYESKGWPCFGILIHESGETFTGLRTLQRCPNILSYVNISDLTNPDTTATSLNAIWSDFNAAFERNIIPAPLQETFLSLATETITTESIHFIDRTSALLSSTLNVSWIETVAMRWHPVVLAVNAKHASALTPHQTLVKVCDLAHYDGTENDLKSIITSKAPLCARICKTARLLDEKRIAGTLSEDLRTLSSMSKPGAPAMIRQLAAAKDRILQIAHEEHELQRATG